MATTVQSKQTSRAAAKASPVAAEKSSVKKAASKASSPKSKKDGKTPSKAVKPAARRRKSDGESTGTRVFVVITSSFKIPGGVYRQDSPDKAAKKAGRMQFLKVERRTKEGKTSPKGKGGKMPSEVVFTIKERVRPRVYGSAVYVYKTVKVKKEKPDVFMVDGKKVVSEWDYVTHAVKGDAKQEEISQMPAKTRRSRKEAPVKKEAVAVSTGAKKASPVKKSGAASPPSPMKAATTRTRKSTPKAAA